MGGRRPRSVPVLARWEQTIRTMAVDAGEGYVFLPERSGVTHRQIPNFIARCPKGDAPALNMVRLRVTWIVGHIAPPTDLLALAGAAGVEVSQLVKYARYLNTSTEDEARRRLRRAPGP